MGAPGGSLGQAQPGGAWSLLGQQSRARRSQQEWVPAGFTEQPPPGATEARRLAENTASTQPAGSRDPTPGGEPRPHFLVLEAKGWEGVQERAGLETGQEVPPPRAQHGVCEAEAEPMRPRPPLSPGGQSPGTQAAGGRRLCRHRCPRGWLPWRKPGRRGQAGAGEGLSQAPGGF